MTELTVRLRDGDRISVRPMQEGDAEQVLAGFARLSPASLRARFLSPTPRLTRGMADDLIRVDHGRIVLLAFDADGGLVGGARAVRHRDDPATADVAVTVGERHRRRGIGSALLRLLRSQAHGAGIDRLAGHVLVDNVAAQRLLVSARAESWLDEPGVLGFELPAGRRRTTSPATAERRALAQAS
jgi:ribosomal protein S18 acetylase RimI-like enzyme